MSKKDFFKSPIFVLPMATIAVCFIGYANYKIYQNKQVKVAAYNAKVKREIADEGGRKYSFGGACSSQGSWTQQALAQTAVLRSTFEVLRSDPKCKGIEGIVERLQVAKNVFEPDENKEKHANWEGLPGDMKALTKLAGKNGAQDRKDIIPLLMGKTIENTVLAGTVKSLADRSRRTLMTGMDLLDQSLDVLPQMDECLSGHPDQLLAMAGASLKLTSAFISSGETAVGRMGTTVAKLATFLHNKKYSKVLRELNKTEYWMSMSCLMETTAEAYCSARDAYDMMDYSLKESELKKKAKDPAANNPLEGYYLLVREIPIITAWLQKVQSGVAPRRSADLQYNTETLDNFTEFKKSQLKLMVIYAENIELINSAKPEQKAGLVNSMLKTLSKNIISSQGSSQNFYTSGKPDALIPFYLIGKNSIPDEVTGRGSFAGKNLLDPYRFIENQAEITAAPDTIASKIGERLKELNNIAAESASKYFQDRMVVDTQNLVDESLTSQSLTVFKSLQNVSNYLGRLIKKSKETRTNLIQLPNIIDTKRRIDDVLGSYQGIKDIVSKYLDMQKDVDSKEDIKALDAMIADDAQLKEAYNIIVDKAYKNFNILSQNDTYLMTRLNTFVRKDYTQRVSEGSDMNEAQRDLMIIAGKNLMDRIGSVNQMNPNDVRIDLSNAQVINERNLNAYEKFFKDQFIGMIAEIKDVIDSPGKKGSINSSSIARAVNQTVINSNNRSWVKKMLISSFNPIIGMHVYTPSLTSLSIDYLLHRERYPLYLFNANRVKSNEDTNGSFALFWSKLCIQALAFQDQDPFYPLCYGAALTPVISDNEKDKSKLSVHYAQNSAIGRSDYKDIINLNDNMTKLSRKSRARNICAYRDFRNKNYAYWMVKNFNDEAEQLKQDLNSGD